MNTRFTFAVAAFCLISLNASARTKTVPAQAVFTATVQSPTAITHCGNSVWAYSVQTATLHRIHPQSGAIQSTLSSSAVGIQGTITALGCAAADLLIGTELGRGKAQLYRYPHGNVAKPRAIALTLPGKGLIRDLFCREGTNVCYAIRDGVYHSGNLQKWNLVDIPKASKIPAGQEKVGENPFAGWQDQFIISDGRYFRGQLLDSKLYLLDPLRAAVVVSTAGAPGEPAQARKWGRWGVWEGQLMWAKGLAPVGSEFLAISDTGLKLVFVFTREGDYIGSFGADGGALRFSYPLAIASFKNRVFVADADLGKVFAFDLAPVKVDEEFRLPQKAEDLDEVLRMNLFRDPAVLRDRLRLRCLGCHDGLETNSLRKFVGKGEHHPLYVTPETKIDLPLEAGKSVTCSSCHDSHHANLGKKEGVGTMLKKPLKPLCLTCHASKGLEASNHPQSDPDASCSECHSSHGAFASLLKKPLPGLCTDCHGDSIKPQSHPTSIDCTSCHSLHDADPKFKFASHSGPRGATNKETCLACHHEKKPLLGKNYHMGEESSLSHAWPQPEAVCIDCHNPHKKVKDFKQVCSECHGGITGTHPAMIPIAETAVAKAVHLREGKVTCATCHEPHGSTPQTAEGRFFFKNPAPILPFCASCHGAEANDYYRNFHKRTK